MLYSRCMIRTQVYLPKELYTGLRLVAGKEKKPAAALIREFVAAGLAKKTKTMNGGAALLRLAQHAVKGLDPQLSMHIDQCLYDE